MVKEGWLVCRGVTEIQAYLYFGEWLTLTVFLHSLGFENSQMSWSHVIGVTLSSSQHSICTSHTFTRQTCRVSVYLAHCWMWTWVWLVSGWGEGLRTCFKAFKAGVHILVKIALVFFTKKMQTLHLYWIKIAMCFLESGCLLDCFWCAPDCWYPGSCSGPWWLGVLNLLPCCLCSHLFLPCSFLYTGVVLGLFLVWFRFIVLTLTAVCNP